MINLCKIIYFPFKALRYVLNHILPSLTRCLPIRNYIVFESEGDFCDNARALYEYMIEHGYQDKYNFVWVVRDLNMFRKKYPLVQSISQRSKKPFELLKFWSIINSTKFFFFTHPYWLKNWKKEQTVINLWHGCGYKGVKGGISSKISDYTLVTGGDYVQPYSEQFFIEKERVLQLGFPRNDLLFLPPNKRFLNDFGISSDAKIIFWMPTFRKSDNTAISDDTLRSEIGLPLISTFQELLEFDIYLSNISIYVVIKIHHLQSKMFINDIGLKNIKIITDDMLFSLNLQLYEILGLTHGLITDYSSVAIDYLLLDKPIAFILEDYKEYDVTRGFLFDNVLEYMPGDHIFNIAQLKQFLLDVNAGKDSYSEKRLEVTKKVHANISGHYSENIIRYFESART